jgi:primosomal protein N''
MKDEAGSVLTARIGPILRGRVDGAAAKLGVSPSEYTRQVFEGHFEGREERLARYLQQLSQTIETLRQEVLDQREHLKWLEQTIRDFHDDFKRALP